MALSGPVLLKQLLERVRRLRVREGPGVAGSKGVAPTEVDGRTELQSTPVRSSAPAPDETPNWLPSVAVRLTLPSLIVWRARPAFSPKSMMPTETTELIWLPDWVTVQGPGW